MSYAPSAVAHHVRTVTRQRRTLPGFINMHSVKNRFLMRVKNATSGLYRRYWLPMTLRDLVVMGGSIFWEPSSLPAFWRVAKCLPRAVKQRRQIMARQAGKRRGTGGVVRRDAGGGPAPALPNVAASLEVPK